MMATNITISASLLDDIFRLLDHLDPRYDRDKIHLHKSGYKHLLERDNDLWQLWIKIKQLQGRIMDTYLETIGDVSEAEKRELNEWVARGYSVYDNPYTLYDERGQPMDYINGCRVGVEMAEDPSAFFGEKTDIADARDWDDDDLPWDVNDLPF